MLYRRTTQPTSTSGGATPNFLGWPNDVLLSNVNANVNWRFLARMAQIVKLYYRAHESVYGENKQVIIKCQGRIYGKEMY